MPVQDAIAELEAKAEAVPADREAIVLRGRPSGFPAPLEGHSGGQPAAPVSRRIQAGAPASQYASISLLGPAPAIARPRPLVDLDSISDALPDEAKFRPPQHHVFDFDVNALDKGNKLIGVGKVTVVARSIPEAIEKFHAANPEYVIRDDNGDVVDADIARIDIVECYKGAAITIPLTL